MTIISVYDVLNVVNYELEEKIYSILKKMTGEEKNIFSLLKDGLVDLTGFFSPLVCIDLLIQKYLEILYRGEIQMTPDDLFNSKKGKESWFSFIPLEILDKHERPFTHQSDNKLNRGFCGTLDIDYKKRFKDRLFHEESNKQAEKICELIMNEEGFLHIDGGALRLCWELIAGEGSAYGWDVIIGKPVDTELKRKALNYLFEKAHQELWDCCKMVFQEDIPANWKG